MNASSILGKKPGPQTAFLSTPDPDLLAETLVAFANTDGGTIIIGMTPEGQVSTGLFPDEVEEALRQAQIACRPPIATEWEQIEVPGGFVVGIRVSRSAELHSLADGRVLVRSGTENQPLGGEAIRQLAATKSSGEFEAEPVPGASREDLDEAIIDEYIAQREERQRRPLSVDRETLLRQITAVTADGRPTVAGMLLFGREPQVFLPQSAIVFVKFVGTEPRGPEGLPGYGRREEITGPLPRLIERAWNIVMEEMRVEAVVRGLKREERPEYPPFAVREALINAVCHRDYRLAGRRIEVRMFDDRLEVQSPGGLPGYITLDNIVEEHFSRNPRIVNGLFQWGYIEELGLGIDRMIEAMVQAGHPQPTFRATPYSFTVILQNVIERATVPQQWEANMNERQLRALQYIQEHGRITNREYRELCPHVSSETLRLDLVDLVDKGLLLKIGNKRGTYYILK
ncbi:MAG: transcriptional regulator [Chloroflexi bacterium]|nr:transcriptional regulator [Chloroflexota bacterium]